MIAEHENALHAQRLLSETIARQGIKPGELVLHADRGQPMRSKRLSQLLADLDVTKSHSRPHVSDDNPFSESQFKTLKYHPHCPERFGGLEDGRRFGNDFFSWYNEAHHHSALAYLTPRQVHFGQADEALRQRHNIMLAAYAKHPERFIGGPPQKQSLARAVYINPPTTTPPHQPTASSPSPVEVISTHNATTEEMVQ